MPLNRDDPPRRKRSVGIARQWRRWRLLLRRFFCWLTVHLIDTLWRARMWTIFRVVVTSYTICGGTGPRSGSASAVAPSPWVTARHR